MKEIEFGILKTLITNKRKALEFAGEYDSKLFSSDNWTFANQLLSYIKANKEIPTLKTLTVNKNKTITSSLTKTWDELQNFTFNQKEFNHNVKLLKQNFSETQIFDLKESLKDLESGKIDVDKILSKVKKNINVVENINAKKTYDRKTLKKALPQFVESFNARKNNPDLDVGLKTKYQFFDEATNGVKSADFILVAGESGFGKSLLLNNLAVSTWMQDNVVTNTEFTKGKNVVYFSLEMPYEDCFNRLLSKLSGVEFKKIENAKLSKEEFARIKQCLDFINNYPYEFEIIDIADACSNDIEAIIEDIDYEISSVFVDYLGIMKPNDSKEESDWLKQGIISYELRGIARKFCLPIFSAVQLNRKSNNKDSSENVGLSRLARSGTIATHATTVLQIESRQNEELHPDMIIHIIKNRKGKKGKGRLIKNLACAALLDCAIEESDVTFTDVDDISEQLEDLSL